MKKALRETQTMRALAVVRFEHRPPVANTQTYRQDRLQYTAPQLASAQCNNAVAHPVNELSVWMIHGLYPAQPSNPAGMLAAAAAATAIGGVLVTHCSMCMCVCEGMHKKSIEASRKLKEEEERTGGGAEDGLSRLMNDLQDSSSSSPGGVHLATTTTTHDRRTESIALLRSKAQSYSARMLHGLTSVTSQQHNGHVTDFASSPFQTPSLTMMTTGC